MTETEEIAFTAEGRFLEASFYTGGLMKIPREVKEVRSDIPSRPGFLIKNFRTGGDKKTYESIYK